ncbi:DUF3152 domain-containing protein [Streptosporangium sp. NPDC050855]|uniref:DUF3152 domain-containing protein n=1 Tax=Streptosporangium sp. NPDC050855 TaxID=3366194 RepID=UPI00378FA65A
MSRNEGRRGPATLVRLIAVGIVSTIAVGFVTLLSGRLDPVPAGPVPAVALPPAPVTPTPPPRPPRTPGPGDTNAGTNADAGDPALSPADEPLLLANGRQQPLRVKVPRRAKGRYAVAPGGARPPGRKGKVIRYAVEVERGLPFDVEEFASEVHRILNDPRGWGFRFRRVARGPVTFKVSLTSPRTADRRCLPLRVVSVLSCWNGERAVINADRWNTGAWGYGRDVASYREYVVNHEVGHALGHGHVPCPGPGRRAPLMLQQTKSLSGCRPNPWPFPGARSSRAS